MQGMLKYGGPEAGASWCMSHDGGDRKVAQGILHAKTTPHNFMGCQARGWLGVVFLAEIGRAGPGK